MHNKPTANIMVNEDEMLSYGLEQCKDIYIHHSDKKKKEDI